MSLIAAEMLLEQRRLGEALAAFNLAEIEGAEANRCAGGRWLAHMLGGEFGRAWEQSDEIRTSGGDDPNMLWRGEPIVGRRVILRCLHGFGDAAQFLRYAPRLREVASSLIVEVAPRFTELARCFDGVDEVITWGEQAPRPAPSWDAQVEIMQLPYLFRTQVNDLPIATDYLRLPLRQRNGLADKLQIGLAWSAGEWNPARSLSPDLLTELVATRGCEFWTLQGGEEKNVALIDRGLRERESCRTTLMGLAEQIASLDLVITVDSLAAHLAGAMGIPAWVLLRHAADWRWMIDRTDCPWYPALRLFRQASPGNWAGVLTQISHELQELSSRG